MSKSFYDLDYIIEVSEKRLAEYTGLYQKVLERLTNIILIYSALGIFLVQLTRHVLAADIADIWFYLFYVLFAGCLLCSVVYVVRLLLPDDIAYLDPPQKYYAVFRDQLEQIYPGDKQTVDDSLKSSYIFDLEESIKVNRTIFRRKSSFFYNALTFALLAAVPYTVCLGFHLSRKEGKAQKIELIKEKNS